MAITATAQYIIDQALTELGLPTSQVGSTQVTQLVQQSLAILNSLGDDTNKVHDWQFLEKVAAYTGDGVNSELVFPTDFGRIVNQTQWSSNMRRPMIGPLTPQEWGWTQYGIVSVGIYYRYRILDNLFAVYPTPALNDTFNFFYISKNWVRAADGTLKDTITATDDVPLYDRGLMVAGLKLRMWQIKGFDTTALAREFNYRLEAEKGQNQGAQAISLSGEPGFHLLDANNIPDGSWQV